MGFDVYGIKKLEGGEENYFRNNCWHWRPLWEVCYFLQCFTHEQYDGGATYDGFIIDEETSVRIYMKLEIELPEI